MSKTTVRIKILAIQNDGIHLMVNAAINRKKAVLILDTGASQTVFDKARIKRFTGNEKISESDQKSTGVGGNNITSHITLVKSFRLGKLVVKNYETVLLDLSHVNEMYKQLKMPVIDGVLGSDILFNYGAVIDYPKRQMHLN